MARRTHRKLVRIYGQGRDHKFEHKVYSWENKKEAVSTWAGTLQDPEKSYKLKNSVTRGRNKHGACVPIESLR